MLQDLYSFDVFVNMYSDKVTPDVRNHYDGEQIRHTVKVPDVRAFYIEAAGLQPLEHCLYLPSQTIHLERLFGFAIPVFLPCP